MFFIDVKLCMYDASQSIVCLNVLCTLYRFFLKMNSCVCVNILLHVICLPTKRKEQRNLYRLHSIERERKSMRP